MWLQHNNKFPFYLPAFSGTNCVTSLLINIFFHLTRAEQRERQRESHRRRQKKTHKIKGRQEKNNIISWTKTPGSFTQSRNPQFGHPPGRARSQLIHYNISFDFSAGEFAQEVEVGQNFTCSDFLRTLRQFVVSQFLLCQLPTISV